MYAINVKKENWFDRKAYPFKANQILLDAGTMHYVDEGDGEPIVFVHGTPSWSFEYRKMIKALSATHRCIASDHLGFGLSEKPEDFAGTPEQHAKHFEQLMLHLKLDNITLVVHDFGGPIGLSFALKYPEKIKQIVVMNTWLWETKSDKNMAKAGKLLHSWIGRFLYLNLNFSPQFLLKQSFFNKKELRKNIHQHYINVFPNKASRMALLKIGQSLIDSSDWFQHLWNQLFKVEEKPILLIWGTKDPMIPMSYLEKWKKRLPKAKVKELESGHFPQEENPSEVIRQIQHFLKIIPTTSTI